MPDAARDRVVDGADISGEDALGWDEQVGQLGQVGPSRPARGPVLRRWLRALPAWVLGVALVTAATAWPWLLLMGWLQRGGPYFWWFVLGCLAVVALTWLRFLDERALRAVPGIRGPSVERERQLTSALAAAGAPPATVWIGRVGSDRTRCLATPTRCHVVVPLEPSVDDATLAADAARRLRTSGPWLRPLSLVAGAAWLGPFTLGAQLVMRRLGIGSGEAPRGDGDGGDGGATNRSEQLEPADAVDPITTAVAFLSAGLTGFATAGAAAAVLGEGDRLSLNSRNPWVTVFSVLFFAALTWMIVAVWPRTWFPISVDGARSRGTAPLWRGTNDPREARRNRAVIAGRRSLVQVFGTFGSWLVATMWVTWAPIGLAERFGWIEPATTAYQLVYLVLVAPALALGVYAFRSAWDLQRGNPFFVVLWSVVYVATTGLTPLLVWCLAAAGAVDETSGAALLVAHVVVAAGPVATLGALGRHLMRRRGIQVDARPSHRPSHRPSPAR
ncbi:hypothetical protein GCM10009868_10710 [Terrabacter aerolatus]|uniref:Uncharacterized protein n=1 Tax=Terrabacter aerolatus TaxID=422442 RepID=A0A512D428_9MICO|nr:hypothetical protein TAE01_30220 [Terrabacter aerolatus]